MWQYGDEGRPTLTVNSELSRSFGVLIAYILPGFILLWALSFLFPPVERWLTGGVAETPVIGGVVYATAASIIAGMILNAIRWIAIDPIHHATGLTRPQLDDAKLEKRLAAFTRLVEDHFRYHQFYANTALALLIGHPLWRHHSGLTGLPGWAIDALAACVVLVLLLASRDALGRYYARTNRLLGLKD